MICKIGSNPALPHMLFPSDLNACHHNVQRSVSLHASPSKILIDCLAGELARLTSIEISLAARLRSRAGVSCYFLLTANLSRQIVWRSMTSTVSFSSASEYPMGRRRRSLASAETRCRWNAGTSVMSNPPRRAFLSNIEAPATVEARFPASICAAGTRQSRTSASTVLRSAIVFFRIFPIIVRRSLPRFREPAPLCTESRLEKPRQTLYPRC